MKNEKKSGMVFWVTGLPGAGKTTLSGQIRTFIEEQNIQAISLDGDTLREILGSDFGYSTQDRKKLAGIYSRLCQNLSSQGFVVICATVSMFEEIRKWNRDNIENYFEIYVKVSEETLLKRNQKNIYTDHLSKTGTVAFFGQDFELPSCPDYTYQNENGEQQKLQLLFSEIKNKILELKIV